MKNLDLPTAIREGAKLRGRTRTGNYYNDGRSCAIGAAYEAETGKCEVVNCIWPELLFQIDDYITLGGAIVDLNDKAGWTRKEIADWVDMVLP